MWFCDVNAAALYRFRIMRIKVHMDVRRRISVSCFDSMGTKKKRKTWRRFSFESWPVSAFWQPSHHSKWSLKEYQGCFLESWDAFLPFLLYPWCWGGIPTQQHWVKLRVQTIHRKHSLAGHPHSVPQHRSLAVERNGEGLQDYKFIS